LADGAERARLGGAARAAADGEYSWEHAAEKTLALYRALVA
jgi:glycosyltransferase involved in cell wall biosynthesis